MQSSRESFSHADRDYGKNNGFEAEEICTDEETTFSSVFSRWVIVEGENIGRRSGGIEMRRSVDRLS